MPEDGRSRGGKRRWTGIPSNLLKAADAVYPLLPFPLFLASLPTDVVDAAAQPLLLLLLLLLLPLPLLLLPLLLLMLLLPLLLLQLISIRSRAIKVVMIHLYYTPNNSKIHFCRVCSGLDETDGSIDKQIYGGSGIFKIAIVCWMLFKSKY